MINCCVHEDNKLDLTFDENRTVYMTTFSKFDKHCKNQLPDVYINGKTLCLIHIYKCSGHNITYHRVDHKDILRYVQVNLEKVTGPTEKLQATFLKLKNEEIFLLNILYNLQYTITCRKKEV